MRRSKLETYEAVLEALIKKPLTIDNIAYEANMDCAALKPRLDFLLENSLIEERSQPEKTHYALTERGITVLKTLNFQKYLEKIASTIRTMDEALQIVPTITRNKEDDEQES
jgi:predicted transcriptional regulator